MRSFRVIRIPAADISGAILASALVHLAGWADGRFPYVLIAFTQLMVGISLGVGFVGISRSELARAIGLGLAGFVVAIGLALGVALSVARHIGVEVESLVLAFSPGGLAEMSLVALSLKLSVPFVTLHHLFRIFFTVAFLPRVYRWLSRRAER